jgi:hypothetical protein
LRLTLHVNSQAHNLFGRRLFAYGSDVPFLQGVTNIVILWECRQANPAVALPFLEPAFHSAEIEDVAVLPHQVRYQNDGENDSRTRCPSVEVPTSSRKTMAFAVRNWNPPPAVRRMASQLTWSVRSYTCPMS